MQKRVRRRPPDRLSRIRVALAGLLACATAAAHAEPRPGRYLPLPPGGYADVGYGFSSLERSFTEGGRRAPGITPNAGDSPVEHRWLEARGVWHLPLWEAADLPFFSTRTHRVAVGLGYHRLQSKGLLADFTQDPERRLAPDGSGLGDLRLSFGSFLLGSSDWRTRLPARQALLLSLEARLPFGVVDRNAPVNAGSNTYALGLHLGGALRLAPATLLEAGLGAAWASRDQEPAFGGIWPEQVGRRLHFDASVSQRLTGPVHAWLHVHGHEAAANRYRNPRFALNPPAPPPGGETVPVAGRYRDDGTRSLVAGGGLSVWLGERTRLSLLGDWPLSGRSGAFDLPFETRQPAGCLPGALNCQVSPAGSVRVDGLGPARVSASPTFRLELGWQFGLGDPYPCPGCSSRSP